RSPAGVDREREERENEKEHRGSLLPGALARRDPQGRAEKRRERRPHRDARETEAEEEPVEQDAAHGHEERGSVLRGLAEPAVDPRAIRLPTGRHTVEDEDLGRDERHLEQGGEERIAADDPLAALG